MTPTWGIPGPVFLLIWIPLAIVTLLLPRLVLVAARWGPSAPPDHTLTPEQLGALAGGPERAVAASVAGLVENGRLRLDGERTLCAVVADGRPTPEDDPTLSDLDVAVLHSAESPTAGRQVLGAIDPWFRARDLDEQLVARGLLRDPAQVRSRARLAWIPFGLVIVLALARLAAGLGHGASIGFLGTVVVIAAIVALWARPKQYRVLTPAGRATLTAVRAATRPTVPAGTHPSYRPALVVGAGVLVALGGLAAFPDPAMAALLVPPTFVGGGGGGDGGSSCGSSCGASCGGGSSSCGGGGGCGG